jgi:putative DNA primase/helicase
MGEFVKEDIPPRDYLLYPFIQEKGLSMLYAKRGTGKTFVALSMALAIAGGLDVMNFHANGQHKVLYIDGEMPGYAIQERLNKLAKGLSEDFNGADNLFIFNSDLQDYPMPNLATKDGQKEIDKILVNGIKVLIIDNLSALCSFGHENEAESWRPMQTWLLDLRRRGVTVLLIDHAGKNGDNRGTSKKQDILDSVICLENPDGHKQTDGARFIIRFEKSRNVCGEAIDSFETQLQETTNGELRWQICEIQPKNSVDIAKAKELKNEGKTVREIAENMGIGKTKAAELLKC